MLKDYEQFFCFQDVETDNDKNGFTDQLAKHIWIDDNVYNKTLTISAGLEPAIFCSVGRRVIHCAMRPRWLVGCRRVNFRAFIYSNFWELKSIWWKKWKTCHHNEHFKLRQYRKSNPLLQAKIFVYYRQTLPMLLAGSVAYSCNPASGKPG